MQIDELMAAFQKMLFESGIGSGFLSDADIHKLTGRKQPDKIIAVLKKQGIAFKRDGDGRPVVAWISVNAVSGKIPKQGNGTNPEALQRKLDSIHGTATKERGRTSKTGVRLPQRVQVLPQRR